MPLTPIIIGVSSLKHPVPPSLSPPPPEPLSLIYNAIQSAVSDASCPSPSALQAAIDSIDVVRTWTWPYADLPGLLATRLGVSARVKRTFYSEHGGDKPGALVDGAARRVASGEVGVAVVAGGEALASLSACVAAKQFPPAGWTQPSEDITKVFTPTGMDLGHGIEAAHSLGTPIQIYPLYENAFRVHRGQSLEENHRESAKLYAEFARIAAQNPTAWFSGKAETEERIARVDGKNRMICYPYPLLMNAFNTVNLSSAIILTSTETARSLGIPESKWIYPLGGAGTSSPPFQHRSTFHASPALSATLSATFTITDTPLSRLSLLDIYSCFPIVPKLAAQHLGLPITDSPIPLTVLGGLTSFGGAGNNYGMHAIAEVARRLRHPTPSSRGEMGRGNDNGDRRGLVLCNGGVLTYMHAIVLGTAPRRDLAYPVRNPLDGIRVEPPGPAVVGLEGCEGDAVVETYTVEFQRDNTPLRGYVIGRVAATGHRFLANHGDAATLRAMGAGAREIVGSTGFVRRDPGARGRNLFFLSVGKGVEGEREGEERERERKARL